MSYNLDPQKKVLAVSLLSEGSSIRSVERVTGVHRDTLMRLGVRVGTACAGLMDKKMRNLPTTRVEVDEVWGFIGKKNKRATIQERAVGVGDVWTWVAMDADSKLIPVFVVGKRDAYHAKALMAELASRVTNRLHLSTDGLAAYADAVERAFGSEVDYGQIEKTYSVTNLNKDAASRYSPADVVKVERVPVTGAPVKELVSTSLVEKQHHTLRMHCRRLTRLTNAFSKKLENFTAAVSLNFAYYNFCKRHITIRMTPAQAAGVESSQWTVAELLERCDEL